MDPPAERGNADVAGKVQTPAAKKTKVVSPRPNATAAAPAEGGPLPSVAEKVAEKDSEINRLNKELANHPLDKLKAAKQAKNTVSTEVGGVPVDSPAYWITANGKGIGESQTERLKRYWPWRHKGIEYLLAANLFYWNLCPRDQCKSPNRNHQRLIALRSRRVAAEHFGERSVQSSRATRSIEFWWLRAQPVTSHRRKSILYS